MTLKFNLWYMNFLLRIMPVCIEVNMFHITLRLYRHRHRHHHLRHRHHRNHRHCHRHHHHHNHLRHNHLRHRNHRHCHRHLHTHRMSCSLLLLMKFCIRRQMLEFPNVGCCCWRPDTGSYLRNFQRWWWFFLHLRLRFSISSIWLSRLQTDNFRNNKK